MTSLVGKRPYSYKPLDSAKPEIRLLRLLPESATEPSTTIECQLLHANLDEKPQYEALSYVWGTSPTRYTIQVDNAYLKVTPNLFEALYHLRTDQPKTWWIDAISINQEDIAERNHQVGMMQMIFSGAVQTNVWLGNMLFEPVEDNSSFLEWLQAKWEIQKSSLRSGSSGVPSALDEYRHDNNVLENLKRILAVEWSSRIWIVQEVASSATITVHVGKSSMEWEALVWAFERLISDHRKETGDPTNYTILNKQRMVTLIGHRQALWDMVVQFCHWEASDPMDKVYALTGLWSIKRPGSTFYGQPVTSMPIDYGISEAQMYTELAKFHLLTDNSLDFLDAAGYYSPDRGIPSWSPVYIRSARRRKYSRNMERDADGQPYFCISGTSLYPKLNVRCFVIAEMKSIAYRTTRLLSDSLQVVLLPSCDQLSVLSPCNGRNEGYYRFLGHCESQPTRENVGVDFLLRSSWITDGRAEDTLIHSWFPYRPIQQLLITHYTPQNPAATWSKMVEACPDQLAEIAIV